MFWFAECYEKERDYKKSINLYRQLLSLTQKSLICYSKREDWWTRLVICVGSHEKDIEGAISLCISALADKFISEHKRLYFSDRLHKLKDSKNGKLKRGDTLLKSISFENRIITAESLSCNEINCGKRIKIYNEKGAVYNVEAFVIQVSYSI